MMNEEEFDQLSLPKDSANENLETRSRTKLAVLFSADQFELRDELQHDKGVDIFIELKRKSNFTNFRVAVQLKATHAGSYNQDGSLSFALDVSNINYLMNHCMPAYYILYEVGRDVFFYAEVFLVHEELTQKYAAAQLPKSYSYRFQNSLDAAAIQTLHHETFEKGRLFRSINPLLQMNLQQNQPGDTVVISDQREVYTTAQKVAYLEKFGFQLLNASEFKQVIELEQKCYPLPKVGGAFHFIAGMAYYHQANMYKAIDHFKNASKMTEDLHPEMGAMLGYHIAMARFALGSLSREEIDQVIAKYKDSAYVGLYLRVQEAYVDYVTGNAERETKYQQFHQTLDRIKSDPACDANIRLLADAQALQVEGQRLNDQLMMDQMLNRAVSARQHFSETQLFDAAVAAYNSKVKTLQSRAQAENNILNYLIICLNSLKINYSAIAMAYCIRNFDEVSMTSEYELQPEARAWLEERNAFLDDTAGFYYEQSFLENMVVALSLKYEILHFMGEASATEVVKIRVATVLDANDLKEYQRKFDHLINGGTVHQMTLAMLVKNFEKVATVKPEADQLQKEMEAFDAQEKERTKIRFEGAMNIDIFPIGLLTFPGEAFEAVMNALHIEGPVLDQFEWMLKDDIVAQVNVLNDPVTSEGHGEGMMAHKGIESQRNIYRIRKFLFENGYYRLR